VLFPLFDVGQGQSNEPRLNTSQTFKSIMKRINSRSIARPSQVSKSKPAKAAPFTCQSLGMIDSPAFHHAARKRIRSATIVIFESLNEAARAVINKKVEAFLTNSLYAENFEFWRSSKLQRVMTFQHIVPPGIDCDFSVFKAADTVMPGSS
jgi:hypothetical protein